MHILLHSLSCHTLSILSNFIQRDSQHRSLSHFDHGSGQPPSNLPSCLALAAGIGSTSPASHWTPHRDRDLCWPRGIHLKPSLGGSMALCRALLQPRPPTTTALTQDRPLLFYFGTSMVLGVHLSLYVREAYVSAFGPRSTMFSVWSGSSERCGCWMVQLPDLPTSEN